MKYFISLLALVLISGCAFKQSEAKPDQGIAVQPLGGLPAGSILSYNAFVAPTKEGDVPASISGSTTLTKDSTSQQLRGDNALILPTDAPDSLTVEARVVDGATPGTLRAELRVGEKLVREIPSAAFVVDGGKNGSPVFIKFALTELKQFFATDTQSGLNLDLLSVDDRGKSSPFISFALSTPPSKTGTTSYLPVELFERTMKVTVPESVRQATTADGRAVNLVGIFEVKNNEAAPIEVTVPNQLSHTLDAVELLVQASTSECGHSVSKTPTAKRVPSELWLMPLQTTSSTTTRIAPGEVGHVGVYAATPGALTPVEDRLAPQTVVTRCMAHCQRGGEGDWADRGKWGWDCYYCGTSHDIGETCYGCMRSHREWCRWQDWRDWKDYASVLTGIQYSFNMTPAADKDSASAQYVAKFLGQSVPGRMRPLLSEPISIKR